MNLASPESISEALEPLACDHLFFLSGALTGVVYCETVPEMGIARDMTPVPMDSVAAFVAKRPLNSTLDTTKFQQLTGIRPRPWRDAIRDHVMQNITRVV